MLCTGELSQFPHYMPSGDKNDLDLGTNGCYMSKLKKKHHLILPPTSASTIRLIVLYEYNGTSILYKVVNIQFLCNTFIYNMI